MTTSEFQRGIDLLDKLAAEAGLNVRLEHRNFDNRRCDFEFSRPNSTPRRIIKHQWDQNFVDDLPGSTDFQKAMCHFLASVAARLIQPDPDEYMTLSGLAISVEIQWPFRPPPADRNVKWIPALVRAGNPVSRECSVSVNIDGFAESSLGLPTLQAPAAEGFVVNAIRRAVDARTIQFHPVGTRLSSKTQVEILAHPTEDKPTPSTIQDFLRAKVFWLGYSRDDLGTPVPVQEPYDIRYLAANSGDLLRAARELEADELIALSPDGIQASATKRLLRRANGFRAKAQGVLGVGRAATSEPAKISSGGNQPVSPTYDVFLSHASEDKAEAAEPLAARLTKAGVRVWLDQFCLTVGDSLRQKIDEGLRKSRYGIVILSHSFFAKHWPQQELDGLSARESNNEKVILPVWFQISRDEVLRYSPLLAARVAARWNDGIEKVVGALLAVLRADNGGALALASTAKGDPELLEIITSILETRIVNRLYPELNRLRRYMLAHPPFLQANRMFFDKWLSDPFVEEGKELGGSHWSQARVERLHQDLAGLVG